MEFKCKKAGNECYGLKELVLLFDISQRLIQSKELKNDLSAILEMLVRHQGAERSFLTTLDYAAGNGFSRVNLEVWEDNYPAKSLYKKMGFTDCVPRMMFWERKL